MSENIFKRKTKIIDDDEEKEVVEKPLTTEEKLNQIEKFEKINPSAFKNHNSTIDRQKNSTSESNKASNEKDNAPKSFNTEGKDIQKIRDLILAKKSSNIAIDKEKTNEIKKTDSIQNKSNTPSKEKAVTKDSNILNAKSSSISNNIKKNEDKINKSMNVTYNNQNNSKKPSDTSNLKNGSIKSLLEKANSSNINVSKTANNFNLTRTIDKASKDHKVLTKKRKRSLTPDRDGDSESDDSDYSSGSESSSRSQSDSESESSSESSSSEVSIRKKKNNIKDSVQKKKKLIIRSNTDKINSSGNKQREKYEKKNVSNHTNGKILKPKDSLIYQLLKRWWYAIEEWPPKDYNPEEKLKNLKLYIVDKSEWKLYPTSNEEGFSKCCEFDGFKFVFIDYTGKIHDLRPDENRPSYNNFSKFSEKQLYSLLVKALKNQIQELKENEKYSLEDDDVLKILEKELKSAENNLNRLTK